MGYTLTIKVGGLCMLAQRTERGEEGLYILMPETKHIHMLHCPVVITEAANTPGGIALLAPLTKNEDLCSLAAHASAAAPPGRVLEMSKYAGKKVDATAFTGAHPHLTRRIRLPLGSTMVASERISDLVVPDGAGGGEILPFVGIVIVTVVVPATDKLDIAGMTLTSSAAATPDAPKTMTITILHAPPSEWMCERIAAVKNAEATHVEAYYALLETGGKRPKIRHGQDHVGTASHPHTLECPTGSQPAPNPCHENFYWIDPANCTVGIGDG